MVSSKKRKPATTRKASTRKRPVVKPTVEPEPEEAPMLDPGATTPVVSVPGSKDSEYRLWVNPRGPEWKSFTTRVEQGRIPFKADRVICSGPEGFEVPDEDLYEHLLEKTSSTGIPYFLKKKPVEK